MMLFESDLWTLLTPQGDVPVQVTIGWDFSTPLEIRLAFHVNLPEPVEWVFSRDLLGDAFDHPGEIQGQADVKAQVLGDYIRLDITSPFGEAAFRTDAYKVRAFLRQTYDRIAVGAEIVDVDAAIAQILG